MKLVAGSGRTLGAVGRLTALLLGGVGRWMKLVTGSGWTLGAVDHTTGKVAGRRW